MYDNFDTQIQPEEFYTEDEVICELLESPCVGCGACDVEVEVDADDEIGELEDAMEPCDV